MVHALQHVPTGILQASHLQVTLKGLRQSGVCIHVQWRAISVPADVGCWVSGGSAGEGGGLVGSDAGGLCEELWGEQLAWGGEGGDEGGGVGPS